jgi:glycosyltransferase involved in cell wall biosynthesis
LRVVQVGFDLDIQRRRAAALLDAWPTLPAVAGACARAGLRVDVVQAAHFDELIERDGVTFHFVGDQAIAGRVASLSPGAVHVNGINHPRAVRRLSRAVRGIPVVVQDHGTIEPHGWRRFAWRWAYQSLAGAIFTAREQARPFIDAGIFRDTLPLFDVVESSSTFTPGPCDSSRQTTGMSGDPCILWTGRLDVNKDPLTALAAFEFAAAELPGARLWCCFGAAPLLGEVRQRIAGSPLLSKTVTLLGAQPHQEMEARYRAADFFVQASHREGSGYSVIEALACGTTPLVTDIPSFRRFVDAGRTCARPWRCDRQLCTARPDGTAPGRPRAF